jgi:hypothetical protein
MALVNSGRLSVQPVSEEAWTIIEMMADKGGWDEINFVKGKPKTTKGDSESKKANKGRAVGRGKRKEDMDEDVSDAGPERSATNTSTGRKRKAVDNEQVDDRRRSTRARK